MHHKSCTICKVNSYINVTCLLHGPHVFLCLHPFHCHMQKTHKLQGASSSLKNKGSPIWLRGCKAKKRPFTFMLTICTLQQQPLLEIFILKEIAIPYTNPLLFLKPQSPNAKISTPSPKAKIVHNQPTNHTYLNVMESCLQLCFNYASPNSKHERRRYSFILL
jgi:hypothetical protein